MVAPEVMGQDMLWNLVSETLCTNPGEAVCEEVSFQTQPMLCQCLLQAGRLHQTSSHVAGPTCISHPQHFTPSHILAVGLPDTINQHPQPKPCDWRGPIPWEPAASLAGREFPHLAPTRNHLLGYLGYQWERQWPLSLVLPAGCLYHTEVGLTIVSGRSVCACALRCRAVVLNWGRVCSPKGYLAMSRDAWDHHDRSRSTAGMRPEALLKQPAVPRTPSLFHARSYLDQKVMVSRLRGPGVEEGSHFP